jgi:hypothetical protein
MTDEPDLTERQQQVMQALMAKINQDPIRDADTSPSTWLYAPHIYEPIAVTQCYPYVFVKLLEDLEGVSAIVGDVTVGDVTRVLPDDDWLKLLMTHVGIIKGEPHGAKQFLATELVEQLVQRIDQRYPFFDGYSPVHIALVAVYRAMRAAQEKLDEEGAR